MSTKFHRNHIVCACSQRVHFHPRPRCAERRRGARGQQNRQRRQSLGRQGRHCDIEYAYTGQGLTGKVVSTNDLKDGRWLDDAAIGPATQVQGFDGTTPGQKIRQAQSHCRKAAIRSHLRKRGVSPREPVVAARFRRSGRSFRWREDGWRRRPMTC